MRTTVLFTCFTRYLLIIGRIFSTLFFSFLFFSSPVLAASPTPSPAGVDGSFGIANYLPIDDTIVHDGDLVSFSSTGYYLSRTAYDTSIMGVITENPAISLQVSSSPKTYPVVSSGNVYVNVVTINGNIKKGDPITTSSISGVGMKATKTGYVVGSSLEDYASNNLHAIKKILVTFNIHYYVAQSKIQLGFWDVLNLSTLATYEEPIQAFKYFTAALVVILSFAFAFFSFARTASKGLEAIGRNPLASRMIQLGIILNIVISVVIILAGLLLAFIVIRL